MSSQVCSPHPGDQSQQATPSHSDIYNAAAHLLIDWIECIDPPGCQSKLGEFKVASRGRSFSAAAPPGGQVTQQLATCFPGCSWRRCVIVGNPRRDREAPPTERQPRPLTLCCVTMSLIFLVDQILNTNVYITWRRRRRSLKVDRWTDREAPPPPRLIMATLICEPLGFRVR